MSKVASLQKSLSDRNAKFDESTARELFLYLIQPVLPQVHSDRLVIVPHEDLNYVPFQVFQNPADGKYLGERFKSATRRARRSCSASSDPARSQAAGCSPPPIRRSWLPSERSRRSGSCFPAGAGWSRTASRAKAM